MYSKPRWTWIRTISILMVVIFALPAIVYPYAYTMRPVLRGKYWAVVSGRPLSTEAGAKLFREGGNWVDAGVATLFAISVVEITSFATGGEVPILIYSATDKRVYAINGQGTAYSGATPDFFINKGMAFPPETGPLAATIPGVIDAGVLALQRFGTKSFKEVIAPALELTENGFPVFKNLSERLKDKSVQDAIMKWKYSKAFFYDQFGGRAPEPGEILRNPDLASTFRKLIEAEERALKQGKNRVEALQAVRDRFYRGDIAEEYCRASKEEGGLHTIEDFAKFYAKVEEPLKTTYRGFEVYKCDTWTQGAAFLQTLNILEGYDLKAFGSPKNLDYVHLLVEAMKLAFADRDKYYGDPDFAKVPIRGLLSKEYAAERRQLIDMNRAEARRQIPGDPWKYEGKAGLFLTRWDPSKVFFADRETAARMSSYGTTSVNVMDRDGNMISMTPSGGWLPSWIAGRTGLPCSQRMQSFVCDPSLNAANVVAPGKRPRITLSPTIILKDGKPFMCVSTQAGDNQEQAMLQVFLNVVEWGMDIQEAIEHPRIQTLHLQSSFGSHAFAPGALNLEEGYPVGVPIIKALEEYPPETIKALEARGHKFKPIKAWQYPCQLTAIKYRTDNKVIEAGTDVRGERWGIVW